MGDEPEKKAGGRLGGTRPGPGVDPMRPPSRIDPGKRRLDRAVSVAIAIPTPMERAAVAKALIQAQCTVTIVDAADDVRDAEVLIADVDVPEMFALIDAVRRTRKDIGLIAWTSRRAMVERGLSAMDFDRCESIDRKARISELVEAVQRVAD